LGGTCTGGRALYASHAFGSASDADTAADVTIVNGDAVFVGYSLPSGGYQDARMIRVDASGIVVWDRRWDEGLADSANAITAVPDGFAVAGNTTSKAVGGWDGWLVRTDAAGNVAWQQRYGGNQDEFIYDVKPLADGFILAGSTASTGGGSGDAWLIRTDASGNQLWTKTFGGSGQDEADAVIALADGFAVSGMKSVPGAGTDAWLIRTDLQGNRLWDQTYGTAFDDVTSELVANASGFALAGYKGNASGADPWLLSIDGQGFVLWERVFTGTPGKDIATSLVQNGSGFALGGWSYATPQGWFGQTDDRGNVVREETIGGGAGFNRIAATSSGFALVGRTTLGAGSDFWLVRTDAWGHATCADSGKCLGAGACDDGNACTLDSCDAATGCQHVNLADGLACAAPGSCDAGGVCTAGKCGASGAKLWSKTYAGDSTNAVARGVAVTPDGLAFVGNSNNSAWLRRTDRAGNLVKEQTYPTAGTGAAGYQIKAVPEGFVVAGVVMTAGVQDGWLFGTDADGVQTWSATFGVSGVYDRFFGFAPAGDGYAAVGTSKGLSAGGEDGWLVLTDAKGLNPKEKRFGGVADDELSHIAVLGDGLALAGYTQSFGAGNWDAWLVRTDAAGNLLFQKTYGGTGSDGASDIVAVGGGFALAGWTPAGAWLARTDAAGNLLWQRTLPDSAYATGLSLLDDGFAVAGWSLSSGQAHAWLARTDTLGNVAWSRTYSSGLVDGLNAVAVLPDGFALAGVTGASAADRQALLLRTDLFGNVTCATSGSCAGKVLETCDDHNDCTADLCDASHGGCYHQQLSDGAPCPDADACAAAGVCSAGKCVSAGPKLFDKKFGGSAHDEILDMAPLQGGFLLVGQADGQGNINDIELDRVDASGAELPGWPKYYSRTAYDAPRAVTVGGGRIAVAGQTQQGPAGYNGWLLVTDLDGTASVDKADFGGNANDIFLAVAGLGDGGFALAGNTASLGTGGEAWLVRTDAQGTQLWQKNFGDAGNDEALAIAVLSEGFALAGETNSVAYGAAGYDGWLIRTDASGGQLWAKRFGGNGNEGFNAIVALADGFAMAGGTTSYGASDDFWLVRTDLNGNLLWDRHYHNTGSEMANSLTVAANGFVLAGKTQAVGSTFSSPWLVRTDATGQRLTSQEFAGSTGYNNANRVLALDDGLLIGGIYADASLGAQARLIRTDLFGNISCTDSGTCAAKSVADCDDQNPCTADVCDASHGGCWHSALNLGEGCPGVGLCDGNGKCVTMAGKSGIPAGSFLMGCISSDVNCNADEKPQHGVTLDAYFMDTTEVTVASYKACVDAGKCTAPATTALCNWGVAGRDEHPVNCVNWDQASGFCAANGDVLPTEAQWERAARGGADGNLYPWGNVAPDCSHAVFDDGSATTGQGCDGSSTMAVGSKAAGRNGYGLYDIAGNVFEWTADWYDSAWFGSGPTSNPTGPVGGAVRVVRGGHFGAANAGYMHPSYRGSDYPGTSHLSRGFRCARPFTPCTDNNPCTTDTPDGKGTCTHTPLPVGSLCPGGLCNLEAKCAAAPQGMSAVPAGTFWMGCNSAKDANCQADESPQHKVTLTTSYFMDTTETTVAQYRACVLAGKCSAPATQQPTQYATYPGLANNPVNFVTWDQARAFCQQKGGDLPTEAQWEMAARGRCEENGSTAADPNCAKAMRTYPWGNATADCSYAVMYNGSDSGCGTDATWAVGSKTPGDSPYGLHDMAGNAWEWNRDWYASYSSGDQTDPTGPGTATSRVYRGCSFVNDANYLHSSLRDNGTPSGAYKNVGVRCIQPFNPCDDGNPCTTDIADGSPCNHMPIATGSACPGGLCNATATCVQAPAGMAAIPAGTFWMGCNSAKDSSCSSSETPQHKVTLSGYFMDLNEVTATQWQACIDGGACTAPMGDTLSWYCNWDTAGGKAKNGREQFPVNYVSWTQAQAYCKSRGSGFDLPTEAQWDMAARGRCEENGSTASDPSCAQAMRTYPWGEAAPDCAHVVMWLSTFSSCYNGTWTVGALNPGDSPFGVHDLAGNVSEWTFDWFAPYAVDAQQDPVGAGTGSDKVARGGGFAETSPAQRTSVRRNHAGSFVDRNVGLRCAKPLQ